MRVALLVLGLLTICSRNVGAFASSNEPTPLESEQQPKKKLSDAQIKQILIDESIAAYSGSCPCPYSTARNGSHCGRRSAYSRAGGAEPLCYPKDVSSERVEEYRSAHPGS